MPCLLSKADFYNPISQILVKLINHGITFKKINLILVFDLSSLILAIGLQVLPLSFF